MSINVRLRQLDEALLAYYAEKYNKKPPDIMRGMFRRIVRSDPTFSLDRFTAYIRDVYLPHETNPKRKRAVLAQIDDIAGILGLDTTGSSSS